jgi:hypothetical protein
LVVDPRHPLRQSRSHPSAPQHLGEKSEGETKGVKVFRRVASLREVCVSCVRVCAASGQPRRAGVF